jgi:PAS domain S-box-containing protein
VFYALDNKLRYTYWNKESENFTGIKSADVIGKSIYDIFPKITNTPLEQAYQYVLNTGKPKSIEHTFVRDKQHYYLESNVYPLSDGISVITKDVTNTRLAQKAVEKYSKDLEELNNSKDKFFSIIAHDLKSPFISLVGFSEILDEDLESLTSDELKYYARNIHKSAKGLLNLLENLLEWSRIHTGRMKFYPSKLNLGELISSVRSLYRENAAKKDITLEIDYDPDLYILADLNMIESVIRNLLSNAIKFTGHGGIIKINAFQNGGRVKVIVEDNGMGISNEDLDKLFKIDKHVSTKGTDEEEGTGLGLILCKEFVEKNDGKITVESELNIGTKFIVNLPLSN